MRKRFWELERLPVEDRRRFLKWMGAALWAPAIPAAVRYACHDVVGGEAFAQSVEDAPPTNFIEIGLRDQWDQGHVFVAPGLATYANQRRGTRGRALALFYGADELRARDGGVYLTDDSIALDPHLDTVAFVDCCEVAQGAIHGHEAASALRSPGRGYDERPGTMPMFDIDRGSNQPQGCENYYSSTPTPATLHNWVQKQITPDIRNGIAYKGISRSIHTVYQFGAGLPGAELDRVQAEETLFQLFPDQVQDLDVMPTEQHADVLARILERVDPAFFRRRGFSRVVENGHLANVGEAKRLLWSGQTRTVSLPLTEEEVAYWSEGVPDRVCTSSDTDLRACEGEERKLEIWEEVAYAFKIIKSGMTRSVALEFDFQDIHEIRTEDQVRIQGKQCARPLARLIESLKAEGIYDRTVIAVYCVDGSRSPAAGSYGNEGKNTLILAGGGIRGGYFGDVRITDDFDDGHSYAYHAPDLRSGAPGEGFGNNDGRIPGAVAWRTVMRALSIPDETCEQFPDVQGAGVMEFLLR